jgi:protein disulfide-isomerase A1
MKFILLVALMMAISLAEVIPFNNDAIEKIFKESNDALFIFIGDETAEAGALDAFKAFDATNPGFVLSVSSKNDGHGLYDRLGEYLGVDTSSTPKVLFLSSKQAKYRYDSEEVTVDNLAAFVQKINSGEIEPFLKSAPIPETNDEPVKIVVGKSWKDYVINSDKEVLVKFYAPWCGHCKTLAPHYDEAAKRLANNPNILLVKVDSTENEVSGVDIQGFPTLKFWGKDKTADPIDYNGGRDAEGIVQWLKEHTQYEWVEPETEQGEEVEEEVDETL